MIDEMMFTGVDSFFMLASFVIMIFVCGALIGIGVGYALGRKDNK